MAQSVIKVDGMSCEHCVKAVTDAVLALPGAVKVKVSLEAGSADIEYDGDKLSLEQIKAAIEEEGYDVIA
jgi:copper chaperone